MVLELSSNVATPTINVVPHHYIFVVDVSDSMNEKLGEKTLLEKVKVVQKSWLRLSLSKT